MTREKAQKIVEKARKSLNFWAYTVDELVDPEFPEEEQERFMKEYEASFKNINNAIELLNKLSQTVLF